jgi:hypothetical protein
MSKKKSFITNITSLKPSEPSESPSESPAGLQTLGLWPTFIYYFVGTTLIGAIASSQALQLDMSSGVPFQIGILLGVLAGGAGAHFNRTTHIEIAIPEAKTFNPKLAETLQNMGYAQVASTETVVMPGYELYRRPGVKHWFSGNLLIQRQPEQVKLYARARITRQLKKMLG